MEEAIKTLFENSPNIAVIVIISLIVYQIVSQTFSFVNIRKDIKKHDKKFDKIEAILVEHSKKFDRIDLRFERIEDKIEEQKVEFEALRREIIYKIDLQDKKIDLQDKKFAEQDKKFAEQDRKIIEQDKRIDLHATLSSLEVFQTAKATRKTKTQQILEPA